MPAKSLLAIVAVRRFVTVFEDFEVAFWRTSLA
jgi:hypothetical protein